jgi:hypothetical protein
MRRASLQTAERRRGSPRRAWIRDPNRSRRGDERSRRDPLASRQLLSWIVGHHRTLAPVRDVVQQMGEAGEEQVDVVEARAAFAGVVVLPDSIVSDGDVQVAGFREDTQALRVAAMDAGLEVDLAVPDGAQRGVYSEHDADWVLPVVAFLGSGAASVGWNLVANVIQRKLDGVRGAGQTRTPVVRYRELQRSPEKGWRLRVIEGPADAVVECLRESDAPPRGQISDGS